jgi:uncharacterized membrane protein YsdA (DUF1294 family)
MMTTILFYLLIVNVVTFFVYGIDKYKARHAKWHHKTMHKKFKYGVPAIFILQVALAVWIISKMAQTPMPI